MNKLLIAILLVACFAIALLNGSRAQFSGGGGGTTSPAAYLAAGNYGAM